MDIDTIVKNLSKERFMFYSEADFKFSLAWQIKEYYSNTEIRLERRFNDKYIDVVILLNERTYGIELKYKTRQLNDLEEQYNLITQGAQNLGKYDFIKDVMRLETLLNDNNIDEGYAIWLTNDHLYWSEPSKDSVGYFEFSVHQNATKKGELNWKQNINRVRLGKRKKKIILDGIYPINWEVYSNIEQVNNGLFKYSINRISH